MTGNEILKKAIELGLENIKNNTGGPFAAIILKDGEIVGKGVNLVTSTNDPTAHAEVNAIRDACKNLNTFKLDSCEIYTTCEPCPMCLGAIYWARLKKVYYGCTKADAAKIDFDDSFIYKEINIPLELRKIPFIQILHNECKILFEEWEKNINKIKY